ncbi:MAG: type transport system ATP-binding protein [Thermotogota bacterium]|nr:type transport system ATP-binding protein [Thermotogota bacterium]MDK2864629.1 type transport system ATP-binding protein [Thermotogota bacterium]HCZ07227.1 ABC transporter ATP-binding protein [Thermotogota bacterium]
MDDFAVVVDNLKKYYGETKAVDGVSFSIRRGEIFTLLGPNGAGKTTTLEILEGLRKPDSGQVTIFGRSLERADKVLKSRIGVMLQETTLFSHLTVRETIELFASFYPRSVSINQLLEDVGLTEKSRTLVKNLSGGQKQRLAFALALVNDPELVFLDEPTTGLDPQARHHVWEIIRRLKKQGKTVFLTTHYMDEAQHLSDHVCIMDHGKIIAEGAPSELIEMLGTGGVVECKVSLSDQMKDLIHREFDENVYFAEDRFTLKAERLVETLERVLEIARDNGITLESVVIRQPNLEDVFLTLTGRELRD